MKRVDVKFASQAKCKKSHLEYVSKNQFEKHLIKIWFAN